MDNRSHYPNGYNAPVPSFGDINAQLLIVGLAPGLMGANMTGRPFTGDYAGQVLYPALIKNNFATGDYQANINDTLQLINTRITNVVRCVPPRNKPTTSEINTCRDFLVQEISAMKNLRVILTLGQISHDSTVKALGGKIKNAPFSHGAIYNMGNYVLVSSYHTSRYNINTGRLTVYMFHAVMRMVDECLVTT